MLLWYVGVHWIYLAQDITYWRAVEEKHDVFQKRQEIFRSFSDFELF